MNLYKACGAHEALKTAYAEYHNVDRAAVRCNMHEWPEAQDAAVKLWTVGLAKNYSLTAHHTTLENVVDSVLTRLGM